MHPELLERAGDLESGRALLDDEEVVALVAALAVGLGDDEGPVAPGAARDEDLPAVDDELVAIALRHRRDPSDVAAGVRLGDCQRRDVLSADGRDQPFALLLFGPELENRRRGHLGLDVDRHAEPAQAGPRHLFGKDDGREIVAALPAVLGWVAQAEETELAEAFEDGVR